MTFSLFGRPPAFNRFGTREPLASSRPSISELLAPLVEPEYPEAPELLTRGGQLGRDSKRQLTMAMLANVAQALSAGGGRLGSALAGAASANIGSEQQAVEQANTAAQQDYARKRQRADLDFQRRQRETDRQQQTIQLQSMMETADQAVELAGGADQDPSFASRVYGALRGRNPSELQKLLDEAGHRRTMRDNYGLDPDDPLALEAYKQKQEAEAKVNEFKTLDPLKQAAEQETHRKNRLFDVQHPAPDTTPQRDRVGIDWTTGQVINMDAVLRGETGPRAVSAPASGYRPRPRSGEMFDDVEREAMDVADRQQADYDRRVSAGLVGLYQDRNPRLPGYTKDPKLLGQPVPFDWNGSYRSAERTRRRIAQEKEAKANPSTGSRGVAPVVSPDKKGVQSGKGAPVGMGGGEVKAGPTARQQAEQEIRAAATKRWKAMPILEKARYGGFTEFVQKEYRAELEAAGVQVPR